MSYTARVELFDGSSGQSSTNTSNWMLIADYNAMSLSWLTVTGTASALTLFGSDEDGLTQSINSSSALSTINAAGIYALNPGSRWIRCVRNSNDSTARVIIQARNQR